jgi:hypothetical protein
LQNKGIKILFGIRGGHDGVSMGSMLRYLKQPGTEAGPSEMQIMVARQITNFLISNGIDGFELYDIDCEIPGGQTPYPAKGQHFWNGEVSLFVPENGIDPASGINVYNEYWNYGGGNLADLLSYVIVGFGAGGSFQGDLNPSIVRGPRPILLREVNFVRHLPDSVPKYDFGATRSCVAYIINTDTFNGKRAWGAVKTFPVLDAAGNVIKDAEGNEIVETLESGTSVVSFMGRDEYAPIILDLDPVNLSDTELEAYSKKFRLNFQNGQPSPTELAVTPYGLIYYENLLPDTAKMEARLSMTSLKVFGEEVVFKQ